MRLFVIKGKVHKLTDRQPTVFGIFWFYSEV